jgi:Uma2 family endonuclease
MGHIAAKTKITPADHGRRMSLAEFEDAETQEGFIYELSRGVIVVSEVPNPWHGGMFTQITFQLGAYGFSHPGFIKMLVSGSDCKILLQHLQSERHPDLAIYLAPRPSNDSKAWRTWIPAMVAEIVTPGSEDRDYGEKREEYLEFGVQEYWIFDRKREQLLVLIRNNGRWEEQIVPASGEYQTSLFPDLNFNCKPVFEAGN